MNVQEKIQNKVDKLAEEVEKDGSAHFEVCSKAPSYGWDKDYWDHKETIMGAMKKRGYKVSSKTNWEVLDIDIVKPITVT
jgi:hypothetical protein